MDVKKTAGTKEEEESGASAKVDCRKKSRRPKKNDDAMTQQFYIPSKVLQARQTPQGEPLDRKYGEVRAERLSCKQGCIFCWKVVTKGHHLKFLCGRYKEGMVEGISLPSFLFPPTFQPFNPLTFHHFHPLTFQPFHPLTFQPFNLLTFQPFHPLIFIPFYPPTSELSALQPSNLSIL